MTSPLALTPPPVAREDVQDGRRVCKRYRHRLGTLVCVARCADQWPVLLVCWDDEPEYVVRVMSYDVTLWCCIACDAALPSDAAGWWRTSAVLVCPHCVPLLTAEDHEELGPTFQPLERSSA